MASSSYELRRYPNGEVRLEVKEYSELFAPIRRGELIADTEKRSDDSGE